MEWVAQSVVVSSFKNVSVIAIGLSLSACTSAGAMIGSAGKYDRQIVSYSGAEPIGSIVIDTKKRFLFHIQANGKATRYGVGVGRAGFEWKGRAVIRGKKKWPAWRPPAEMIEREQRQYNRTLPKVMKGGVDNPLGARALYLYQGNRDTLYRIHGTNRPSTIGKAVSSGCIRLKNEDVSFLYDKIKVGTVVYVR